ncbi:MAG: Ig-like domain-containing protein [Micrococcales bacterium]|nr:Ig-like domain-containing protein [Micrococcales bacterium]
MTNHPKLKVGAALVAVAVLPGMLSAGPAAAGGAQGSASSSVVHSSNGYATPNQPDLKAGKPRLVVHGRPCGVPLPAMVTYETFGVRVKTTQELTFSLTETEASLSGDEGAVYLDLFATQPGRKVQLKDITGKAARAAIRPAPGAAQVPPTVTVRLGPGRYVARVNVAGCAGEVGLSYTSKAVSKNASHVNFKKVPPIKSMKFKEDSMKLMRGQSWLVTELKMTPKSTVDPNLKWKSSKPSVVKIDQFGIATGVKKGTAMITATSHNGKKATLKVCVYPPAKPVNGVATADNGPCPS